jgi:hypothetical protein
MSDEEIKVIDRRGERPKDTPTPPPRQETRSREDLPPVDLSTFIVGLGTQTMMLLGEIPDPQSGEKLTVNLPAARQTIDIIALIQEKTKGNLTADEEKLVQDVLTSLRLAYVNKAKS